MKWLKKSKWPWHKKWIDHQKTTKRPISLSNGSLNKVKKKIDNKLKEMAKCNSSWTIKKIGSRKTDDEKKMHSIEIAKWNSVENE